MSQPPTPEDAFLDFFAVNDPLTFLSFSESQILTYGYGICDLLDDGAKITEIADEAASYSSENQQALIQLTTTTLAGAPMTLCPQHEQSVREQLGELD